MSDKTKTLAIIRSESLVQSLLSDGATALMLLLCIWFSHRMGGGMWEIITFAMLVFWLGCKLPGDMKRVRKITSKREAIDWAAALPDDGSDESTPAKRPQLFAKAGDTLVLRPSVDLTDEQHWNLLMRLKVEFAETAPGVKFVLLPTRFRLEGFDGSESADDNAGQQKAIPFGWREVIQNARDNICGGGYSENRQYEASIVEPYLDGLSDEFEHLQEVCEAVGQLGLPPAHGDVLPEIGTKVLIHLGRSERWVEHTVVGYYVWKDLGGNDSLHRVFVRVKDSEGHLNARMLKDVRPVAAKIGGAA